MPPSAELAGAPAAPAVRGVCVCIVAWNDGENVDRCLSALPDAAAGVDLQVVVVDNGSTDVTAAYLDKHPEVQVVRNAENRGITRARNQAIALVDREFVFMLDADTVPRPGAIAALVDHLDAHPEAGLAGPRLLDPDGSLQLSCRTVPPAVLPFLRRPPFDRWGEQSELVNRHLMRGFDHDTPRPVDWVIGAAQFYRADLLPVVGAYDERIFSHGGEDTDWCLRIWAAGQEVHYVPTAEVVHDYGHFTRKNPLSRQARRGLVDYAYMCWKHRAVRHGVTAP
jgi:GT2 family glycosyltransferase